MSNVRNRTGSIVLSRAEWLVDKVGKDACVGAAAFIEEAVEAQYFQVGVASIDRELPVAMYDIAVDEVEQYMAQGVVVHNSSDPNLQNIPVRSETGREIRKAFIAPKEQVLLSCDYSQIELRVFAHVTRDAELMRAFAADEDIHAATATKLFGVPLDAVTSEMRRRAKTVNFAVIYGQSDFGLATTLGIPNQEARAFIENYFAQFPGVRVYTEATLESARQQGYVQTLLGRRRYLPEINSGNHNIRQAAERAAVNMPIQGTAADIMKLAMIDVYRYLREEGCSCHLLLQVHDELVFGIDEDLLSRVVPEIQRCMEDAFQMDVRLRVDAKVGPNWAEMTRWG